jgi:hypothetical protein
MKRRAFISGTVGGALGGAAAAETVADGGTDRLLATPPVLMAPRADGIELVWAVNRLCRGRVEWREEGGEVRVASADPFGFVAQGERLLRVRIDGLKPATRHALRVIVDAADAPKASEESPWKPFRTLDPAGAATRFVVWNDTHENEETLRQLHRITPEADFLIWNGDTCNDWHKQESLVPVLLHPGGQDFTAGRPMFLTWGNHDVRGKWAFRVSEHIATPDGRPFYAFRSGPVAVICLHTGEDKPDAHPSFGGRVAFEPLRAEQAEWLKAVTARPEIRDAPFKVVLCHIPLRWTSEPAVTPYDSGGYDHFARSSRELWHEALVAWGAQVVISGHTHRPAYLPATDAFPYAQLVSGGPRPDGARWIEVNADADGMRLETRDLEGQVTHMVEFAV